MKKRCKCDDGRKNHHISIRLSKEEYQLIEKLAKDEGITKSNLIMKIFLNDMARGNN